MRGSAALKCWAEKRASITTRRASDPTKLIKNKTLVLYKECISPAMFCVRVIDHRILRNDGTVAILVQPKCHCSTMRALRGKSTWEVQRAVKSPRISAAAPPRYLHLLPGPCARERTIITHKWWTVKCNKSPHYCMRVLEPTKQRVRGRGGRET